MTPFHWNSLSPDDAAFVLLRDLIESRIGIHYGENRRDLLLDRLAALMLERGFSHYLDYYYLLKYDPDAAAEWRRVADLLSVQETYFWRESDQVRALVDIVMPELQASGRPVCIWSAACSSGEEPLTIAMALDQAGWFERLPIEIIASDVSEAALARAQQGTYRERSLRNLAPALRARYFSPTQPENSARAPGLPAPGDHWRISPALLERVQWRVANLAAPEEIAPLASAPVVFCRNVLIYFSDATIQRIIQVLDREMPVPGYLFVGAAESLLRFDTEFELREIGGALAYVKRG